MLLKIKKHYYKLVPGRTGGGCTDCAFQGNALLCYVGSKKCIDSTIDCPRTIKLKNLKYKIYIEVKILNKRINVL